MPGKTNTELIRELFVTASAHEARLDGLVRDLTRLETAITDLKKEVVTIDKRLALAEDKLSDWKKVTEEWDRRRWGLILLLTGSALTLIANVILTLMRR